MRDSYIGKGNFQRGLLITIIFSTIVLSPFEMTDKAVSETDMPPV